MQPFRFSVRGAPASSRSDWAARARKIEALGYSALLVPDHLTGPLAPMPAVVAAAAATTRLRVGTNVLNNDFRDPVLVAHEAATVDLLSDGRLQLGLGAGSIRSEYTGIGRGFERGAVRVARLAEAVAIIKGLLSRSTVTFSGRHYQVAGHTVSPLPVQQPHPPILIGGYGPQLLSLAAREADIVGLSGINFRDGGAAPPDLSGWRAASVDGRIRLIRQAAGEERFRQIEIDALVQRIIVTDDRHKAAAELLGRWPQLTADDLLECPFVLLGTIDGIVADVTAWRERWRISSYTIPEADIEAFAPVVDRLAAR